MSKITKPEDLFAKIDSVFARAAKVFDEMPAEAISLARNVGSQKNVDVNQDVKRNNNGIKIK